MRTNQTDHLKVKKAIVGKDEIINKVLMVILAGGHILLEDVPALARPPGLAFQRAWD